MEERTSLNVTCNQGNSLCCSVSLQRHFFPLSFFFNDSLLYGDGWVGNLDFDEDISIYVTFIS